MKLTSAFSKTTSRLGIPSKGAEESKKAVGTDPSLLKEYFLQHEAVVESKGAVKPDHNEEGNKEDRTPGQDSLEGSPTCTQSVHK